MMSGCRPDVSTYLTVSTSLNITLRRPTTTPLTTSTDFLSLLTTDHDNRLRRADTSAAARHRRHTYLIRFFPLPSRLFFCEEPGAPPGECRAGASLSCCAHDTLF